jgi:hypothetical protein
MDHDSAVIGVIASMLQARCYNICKALVDADALCTVGTLEVRYKRIGIVFEHLISRFLIPFSISLSVASYADWKIQQHQDQKTYSAIKDTYSDRYHYRLPHTFTTLPNQNTKATTMVVVALAGAMSGLGLTVLRHLASSPSTTNTFVVLSRSPQSTWTARGIPVREIDYASRSSLVNALKDVHTVLSFIGGSASALRDSQLALVAAAQEAGVQRFAPSEFAIRGGGYDLDLYAGKREVWDVVVASGMEYTRFSCGIFMSILATGTPKSVTAVGVAEGAESGEQEALAGLRPWNFVVNMRAGTADLPGDGKVKTVFTDTRDVARFVEKALELESWPEELGMRGDLMDWREVIEVLEKVQGRKFLVRENSVEDMEKVAREDEGKRFYNQVRVALVRGEGAVGDELNEAFPNVKPTSVEEFTRKWWDGMQLGESRWEDDQSFM